MMNVNWERLWRASGIAFVVMFVIAVVSGLLYVRGPSSARPPERAAIRLP